MSLQRRHVLLAATAIPWGARAHHGWSSFDPDRPIYLEGTVRKVRWQNPHAELELETPAELKLPADLAQRAVPAQASPWMARPCLPRRFCLPAKTAAGRWSWRP